MNADRINVELFNFSNFFLHFIIGIEAIKPKTSNDKINIILKFKYNIFFLKPSSKIFKFIKSYTTVCMRIESKKPLVIDSFDLHAIHLDLVIDSSEFFIIYLIL